MRAEAVTRSATHCRLRCEARFWTLAKGAFESPAPRRRWLADGRERPLTATPLSSLLSHAPQQVRHPEFPVSTRHDRRASADSEPQRRLEPSAEFHGPGSEVGASGVHLFAEIRCGFGSKSNTLRMGGLPRRRNITAAGLLPLALDERRVGRVPETMSASVTMGVAVYLR